MSLNAWIRRSHRWLSLAFTIAVLVNIAALMLQQQSFWIGLLALVPLIILMISGLYLFAAPYAARLRAGG